MEIAGQSAPLGYVIQTKYNEERLTGWRCYQCDICQRVGYKLNLKKIRGTSFANAMSFSLDDDNDDKKRNAEK